MTCSVDCPVDCSLSPWSPWDRTYCQCGLVLTNKTRTRSVVVSPSATGRPCPNELSQFKPCPSSPCYAWHKSSWSPCKLQGASCGTGVMKRNISCVIKPGNIVVSDSFCWEIKGEVDPTMVLMEADVMDLGTTTSCYVSCDQDCSVSSWTEWNQCSNKKCIAATSVGEQSRNRRVVQSEIGPHGICPPHLSETRPCLATSCYRFQWVVRNGDVFCQRSDGTRVESGCKSSIVGCGPSCWSVAHASCRSGHCACISGYLPQFTTSNSSPRLTKCLVAVKNSSLQGMQDNASKRGEDIQIHYYPDGKIMNYWMFAMISIGCIFIVFVGISIYILCKSTCRAEYPGPDYQDNRRARTKQGRGHQEQPISSLWQ